MPGEHEISDIPVVLFLYRRPGPTRQVLESIRRARPRRLMLIADGPSEDGSDAKAVAAARAVVGDIDWPCSVVRDFAETRLGCGRRISSGLDRVFADAEAAIVLEDDCVPEPGFFRFCAELIDQYRDDPRVMMISGTNPLEEWPAAGASHLFSRHGFAWGWATWRRAWRHFEFAPVEWAGMRDLLVGRFGSEAAADDHLAWLARVRSGGSDIWDVQWLHACLVHDGLAAVPTRNMVTNVGFGPDATHTRRRSLFDATRRAHAPTFPLRLPVTVAADLAFDRRVHEARRGTPSVDLLTEWGARLLERGDPVRALAALSAGRTLHGEVPALAALERRARSMVAR